MNKPLVSIIIPVYNGANYLKDAIDSALAQTYPNIEVLVINDGSNDNGLTENIALSYGDKIRYFYKENGGVASALNLAIKNMKGEYFSWLSHDDMYYPNKIERQIQELYKNGDLKSIVYSAYDLLDVNSQVITHVFLKSTYSEEKLTNSVFPVLQGLVSGCSLLIHKSHFERIGLFNTDLITTQDYDLWFRMFRWQKIIYINEPLIIVRIHNDQGSKTISCHNEERCRLHIGFLETLTEDEMISMYGSPYNFYNRMCCYFKGGKMEEAYRYANKNLQEADIPSDISEKILLLKKYIQKISNDKADKLCIFCAGEYGTRLYHELKSRLINVDYFSDNNSKKWGYLFENIYCISPKELERDKEHTLVIVATRTPDGIVNQLLSNGFPYVITKQELDKILIDIPPIKWISSLESIENLDYSSKDILSLINRFNETIFDLCKYYEDRLKDFILKK